MDKRQNPYQYPINEEWSVDREHLREASILGKNNKIISMDHYHPCIDVYTEDTRQYTSGQWILTRNVILSNRLNKISFIVHRH